MRCEYPATPFIYEARVLASKKDKRYWHVKLILPGVGVVTKTIRHGDNASIAYGIIRASREACRDIFYSVFGDDWRWYEASIQSRHLRRMWIHIGTLISREIK
jgi:hypothetical protein